MIYRPWKGFPLLVEQNRQSLLSFWDFSLDTLGPGHKKRNATLESNSVAGETGNNPL